MKIYCDLDGVLVDFLKGVLDLTGIPMDKHVPQHIWPRLARTPDFYSNLEWTVDGKELWNYIKKYKPTILTGKPRGNWAISQKIEWCRRELGSKYSVIVCLTRDKYLFSSKNSILIDDKLSLKEPWENQGGIFIHHISTEETLKNVKNFYS